MDTDPRSPVCLAPHFEFLPIDSSRRQIRLLNIAPGQAGEVIRCSYEVVSVDDDGAPYHTLSYVWGEMDKDRSIVVEGTEVGLTDNLFSALSSLRHETEPRRMWIDALCINQEDGAEKTAQVNMMHDVYANCVECIMWMGDIDAAAIAPTEREAVDAARGAVDAVRMLAGEDSDGPPPATLATRDQQVRAGRALYALMHTPWWSRIWTVQEATSPRNAVVYWGSVSLPWSHMRRAAERMIRGEHPAAERLALHDLFGDGISSWFTAPVLGLVWASAWAARPPPPLEMLWRFRYRDSTDPRDKVYVILNLVPPGARPLPSVPSSDYAVRPAALYRRVMLDLLRDEWGLRPLIGLRGEPKTVPGLPSWVVDWSLPPPGLGIQGFWEHGKFWPRYTADRGLPMLDRDALTSAELGDDVLNVNGVFFDRVLARGDVITADGVEGDDDDGRLHRMVETLIADGLAREPRHRVISEVYWREALTDIVEGNYADPEDTFEGLAGDVYWRAEFLRFQRLFVTENGAVGLGPSGTAVGDEVWILSGGRSPFLLAPLDTGGEDAKDQYHYTFRGDVFVPGIMEGDAVDSRIDKQRFVHIH